MSAITPSVWKRSYLVLAVLLGSLNAPALQRIPVKSMIPAAAECPLHPPSLSSEQGQTLPIPLRWGSSAPKLALRDSLNRKISLRDFRHRQVLLVIFSHYSCPAHHLYLPKLLVLEPQWKQLNAEVLWVFPHNLSRNMAPPGHPFLLEDKEGITFDAYGILKIPHVVVLQRSTSSQKSRSKDRWKVCYSGSVDADPEGLQPSVRPDLAEALQDLKFSDYVRTPQTPLHGCPYPYPNNP